MAKICELTGKRPMKGSIIWRSGKSKKSGGIGTHITAITKRRFFPNLQRVKALMPSGEVRYIRVAVKTLKKPLLLALDLHVLLGFYSLMEPVGPAPARHETPRKLIDYQNFAVLYNIVDILLIKYVSAYSLVYMVRPFGLYIIIKVFHSQ